jgi:hypothetical protein
MGDVGDIVASCPFLFHRSGDELDKKNVLQSPILTPQDRLDGVGEGISMSGNDLRKVPPSDDAAFNRILVHQIARYPRMEVQDLYKLIFQTSFGSEHAVADGEAARGWLERELRALSHGPEEPIVDPIAPDGRLVRIHLRPFLAARGDLTALLRAFVRTAREYHGTEATLYRYWSIAEQLAATGLLPFARVELQQFFAKMQAQNFPAVHHSAAYMTAYHPAYRLALYKFLAQTPGSLLNS